MQTVQLHILDLDKRGDASDLGNVVTGISGVGRITTDAASCTMSVDYDPDYLVPEFLKKSIEGAGYPVETMNKIDADH